MGEELDVPNKTYSPKDNENNYLKYGLNQVQGWKKSMEDYVIDFTEKEKEKFLNVFGISSIKWLIIKSRSIKQL